MHCYVMESSGVVQISSWQHNLLLVQWNRIWYCMCFHHNSWYVAMNPLYSLAVTLVFMFPPTNIFQLTILLSVSLNWMYWYVIFLIFEYAIFLW